MNYLADTSIGKLIRLIKTEIKRISENINIADGSITRAKLAQNALYSPIIYASQSPYNITTGIIGKYITAGASLEGTTLEIIISDEVGNQIPNGTEFAIIVKRGIDTRISFGANQYSTRDGHEEGLYSGRTYQLGNGYKTVGLKKINYTDTTSTWLIIGEAEVAT